MPLPLGTWSISAVDAAILTIQADGSGGIKGSFAGVDFVGALFNENTQELTFVAMDFAGALNIYTGTLLKNISTFIVGSHILAGKKQRISDNLANPLYETWFAVFKHA